MEDFLRKNGINPNMYLSIVRSLATKYGLVPERLNFPDMKSNSKLMYETDDKRKVFFGRIPYGDFIIWTIREVLNKVPEGYALEKRRGYLKRARGIEEHRETKGDEFSPNQLAMKILWFG
jgi:hypothetical protein